MSLPRKLPRMTITRHLNLAPKHHGTRSNACRLASAGSFQVSRSPVFVTSPILTAVVFILCTSLSGLSWCLTAYVCVQVSFHPREPVP